MKTSWKYFTTPLSNRVTFNKVIRFFITSGLGIIVTFTSCNDKNKIHPEPVQFSWNFESGTEGWTGDFTDYRVGDEASYTFSFGYDTLPEPPGVGQGALKLSGYCANSDLFMYIKKRVSGLQPNTVYYASFSIQVAGNIPGIESNPVVAEKDGVYFSAGVATVEPIKKVEENGNYGLNIGKSNLNQNGENMVVIGTFLNETEQSLYTLKTHSNENPLHFISNENGEAWIIIAIDSGIETAVTIYFNEISVKFF